jgi:Ca2+-binding RTX toxin-like protein
MANPFFDAAFYLAKNPDVAAAGYTLATAEQHYNQYGAFEVRAANPWFDAKAYLATYPDLAAAGVTVATALAHYTIYGINESRSPAPNVNPADFTYVSYATDNTDLRSAFGITDPAHLTVEQQHQLLAHFLSYGLHEGRTGVNSTAAGSFFAAPVPPATQGGGVSPPIGADDHGTNVDGSHISGLYIGTSGADVFTGTQAYLNGTTLQGQGGADKLVVSMGSSLSPPLSITLDSIESIQVGLLSDGKMIVTGAVDTVVVTQGGHAFEYAGGQVGTFQIDGSGPLIYDANGLTGNNDSLTFVVADSTASLSTIQIKPNGPDTGSFEHYNFQYEGRSDLIFSASGLVNANTLTFNFSGGTNTGNNSVILGASVGSNLQTVVVNGSDGTGNQNITLAPALKTVNASITGGHGNDGLVGAADAQHNTVLDGGDGNDTLVASAGIDTMTGGVGNDVFQFTTSVSSNTGAARMDAGNLVTDSIKDFTVGDTLAVTGGTDGSGVTLTAFGEINSRGVLQFNASTPVTLQDTIAAIDTAVSNNGRAAMNMLFQWTDAASTPVVHTYFLSTGATASMADDVIIELTGGVSINQMTANGSGVHASLPV